MSLNSLPPMLSSASMSTSTIRTRHLSTQNIPNLPQMLPYAEEPKRGIVFRVCAVIVRFVKAIFSCIFFWRRKPKLLEERQREILRDFKKQSYRRNPPDTQTSLARGSVRFSRLIASGWLDLDAASDSDTFVEPPLKSDYEGIVFPEGLQKMRNFMSTFTNQMIDCILEEQILPPLKHSTDFFDKSKKTMQTISSLIIQVGVHAKNPVFETMTQHGIRIQTDTVFFRSLREVLNWLIDNGSNSNDTIENPAAFKEIIQGATWNNVEKKLAEKKLNLDLLDSPKKRKKIQILKKKVPFEEVKKQHLALVIEWIFNPKREAVLKASSSTEFRNEIIDAYYEACISELVEAKIDLLLEHFKTKIVTDLPRIVTSTLKTNANILADELSGRLADLLNHINISDLIDGLSFAIGEHVETYLQARDEVRETAQITSKKSTELAKEELETVAHHFATLPKAHPLLNKIATIPNGKNPQTWSDSTDFIRWKESFEHHHLKELVDLLGDAILPSQTVENEGEIKTIDGLKNLWRRLKVPPVIFEFGKEIESFLMRFLPKEFTIAEDIRRLIGNITEQIVVTIIQKNIRIFASHSLFHLFKMAITPESFSQFVADKLLPILEEQCQDILMRNVVATKLKSPSKELKENLANLRSSLLNCQKKEASLYEKFENALVSSAKSFTICLSCEEAKSISQTLFNMTLQNAKNMALEETIEMTLLLHLKTCSLLEKFDPKEISATFLPFLNENKEELKTIRQEGHNQREIRNSLATIFYDSFQEKASEYKKNDGQVKEEEFRNRVAIPFILEFEKILMHEAFLEKTEASAIIAYLEETIPGVEEKDYFSIINNLFFGIGEFGSWTQSAASFAQKQINQSISAALQPLRNEYALIERIVAGLQKNYGDQSSIKKMLEKDEPLSPRSFQRAQEKEKDCLEKEQNSLEDAIHRISGIVYDIFYSYVDTSGFTGFFKKQGFSIAVGSDSTSIENLIKRIYNQLFQHEYLTENLFFRLMDVFGKFISVATFQIQAERERAITPITVTETP